MTDYVNQTRGRGGKRALPDPDTVSLSEAARLCGVSHRTIERLVDAGLLKREQTAPRAPGRGSRESCGRRRDLRWLPEFASESGSADTPKHPVRINPVNKYQNLTWLDFDFAGSSFAYQRRRRL